MFSPSVHEPDWPGNTVSKKQLNQEFIKYPQNVTGDAILSTKI